MGHFSYKKTRTAKNIQGARREVVMDPLKVKNDMDN